MSPNIRSRMHWIIGHDRALNEDSRRPAVTTTAFSWGYIYALCAIASLSRREATP